MTLLDRYLAAQLISAFLKAVAALVMLYIVFDLLTHRSSEIVSRNVPWSTVGLYYAYQAPLVLSKFQLGALAMLVAGLMVFGSAAQNNEIVAMLAGGVSIHRIMRTPLLAALLVSVAIFALQETVGVAAARGSEAIEEQYFSKKSNAQRPGISWSNLPGNWKCHAMKFNRRALTGEDVLMLSFGETIIQRIEARRMYWDDQERVWIIEDGIWSRFHRDAGMAGTHEHFRQIVAPIAESPRELFALDANPATLRVDALAENFQRAKVLGLPTDQILVDLHNKFSTPLLSFVMMWLALPFALRLRRGSLTAAFGISIAIGLSYLLIFVLAQGLGYMGRIDPITASWGPSGFFLALGMTLVARART